MLDVLKFVFSSFWVWLGTLLLVAAASQGLGGVIRVTFNRRDRDK